MGIVLWDGNPDVKCASQPWPCMGLLGLGLLGLLALLVQVVPTAEAWSPDHHVEMTESFFDWSGLGEVFGTGEGQIQLEADHDDDRFGLPANDPLTHVLAGVYDIDCVKELCYNVEDPTAPRPDCPYDQWYVDKDDHGVDIFGGGQCKVAKFPHGNFAHSDWLTLEKHFEDSYEAAVAEWDVGAYHDALHHLGHALHYLQDAGIVFHSCDGRGWADLFDAVVNCAFGPNWTEFNTDDHELQEEGLLGAFQDDAIYLNLRLGDLGRLGDRYEEVGLEYAFRNFPIDLPRDDGPSDWADALTLLAHGQGWDAEDHPDLADEDACPGDWDVFCRDNLGDDWYDDFDLGCTTYVSCPKNLDIAFTGLWQTARMAGGVLKVFASEVGVDNSGEFGNDQTRLVITDLIGQALIEQPDLYGWFFIELGDDLGDGKAEYIGTTHQKESNDDQNHVQDVAIATDRRDHNVGSGYWLPPLPSHRYRTLSITTEVWDDDGLGLAPDDFLGSVGHVWPPGVYGDPLCAEGSDVEVCIHAVKLGDRWDEVPPTAEVRLPGEAMAGWYRQGGDAALVVSDARSGVDETTPEWALEGEPFVSGDVTIPVHDEGVTVFDWTATDNYANRATNKVELRIDTTSPATTVTTVPATPGGDADWHDQAVEVDLACSDDAPYETSGCEQTFYRLDGGDEVPFDPDAGLTLGDGVHVLEYWSEDQAGNPETPRSITIRVDTAPPVTSPAFSPSDEDGSNGWYSSEVVLGFNCDDGDPAQTSGCRETRYRLGGVEEVYDVDTPPEPLRDGRHDLDFWSIDRAGNLESEGRRTLFIDTRAPTTTISPDPEADADGLEGWWVTQVAFTLACEDGDEPPQRSGCDTTWYDIDGETRRYFDAVGIPFAHLGEGRHTLTWWSTDRAGNEEDPRNVAVVQVDLSPPTTRADPNPEEDADGLSGWWVSEVSFTLTCDDGDESPERSGCDATYYELDGQGVQAYDPARGILFEDFGEGRHTFTYWSIDLAGNEATHVVKDLLVDLGDPETTLDLSPSEPNGEGGWWTTPVTVAMACSDLPEDGSESGCDRTEYDLSGAGPEPYDGPFVVDEDGDHILRYRSHDVAGNAEAWREQSLPIDTSIPTVTITDPEPGRTYLDDSVQPGALPIPFAILVGDKTIRVDAQDAVSDIDRVHAHLIPASDPLGDPIFLGEDRTRPYQFHLDGSAVPLGLYTLEATAWDRAGSFAMHEVDVLVTSVGSGIDDCSKVPPGPLWQVTDGLPCIDPGPCQMPWDTVPGLDSGTSSCLPEWDICELFFGGVPGLDTNCTPRQDGCTATQEIGDTGSFSGTGDDVVRHWHKDGEHDNQRFLGHVAGAGQFYVAASIRTGSGACVTQATCTILGTGVCDLRHISPGPDRSVWIKIECVSCVGPTRYLVEHIHHPLFE